MFLVFSCDYVNFLWDKPHPHGTFVLCADPKYVRYESNVFSSRSSLLYYYFLDVLEV